MNRTKALRYAHDAAARCIEHFLADDEWITERFASPEDAAEVIAAMGELRLRHVRSAQELPAPLNGRDEEDGSNSLSPKVRKRSKAKAKRAAKDEEDQERGYDAIREAELLHGKPDPFTGGL
jgi:hypothetical protein